MYLRHVQNDKMRGATWTIGEVYLLMDHYLRHVQNDKMLCETIYYVRHIACDA
jgi:hypothetical protein